MRLGLSAKDINRLEPIAKDLATNGALSVRDLEGVIYLMQHFMKQRMDGGVRLGTEESLFKNILGEMIDLKYEDMEPDLIVRNVMGAVSSFCNMNSVGLEYMVKPKPEPVCETCGGTGEVSQMERVYPNEPHMADVGTADCPDCRPAKEEDYNGEE